MEAVKLTLQEKEAAWVTEREGLIKRIEALGAEKAKAAAETGDVKMIQAERDGLNAELEKVRKELEEATNRNTALESAVQRLNEKLEEMKAAPPPLAPAPKPAKAGQAPPPAEPPVSDTLGKVCPVCGGLGKVGVKDRHGHVREETCPRCDGAGIV